jgi:hypothetical protein
MNLPESKRTLLNRLVSQLIGIPNVAAVVLGGSYASGMSREDSDLDIGLYYFEANPFSIDDIRIAANSISDKGPATVTGFYEWGAWVNGGAWIHTESGKVDFLYRNIDHIQRTITEAHQGIVHHDYDQQPTYGFYSVIYLAETQICIPLYDPGAVIEQLKRQVEDYPPKLKRTIVGDALWLAEFTLIFARNFAVQSDIYNTVGCLTRTAASLTQALFALNERYFIRDKKVMDIITAFPILPIDYAQELNHILACPGSSSQELTTSVQRFDQLWQSVVSLAGDLYQPKFSI